MTDHAIEVPHRRLTVDHGTLTATCTHPHRVGFHAGYNHTAPIVINGVDYKLAFTLRHDEHARPRWQIDHGSTWRALHRSDGRDTTDAARRALDETIVPELLRWLATPDSVTLQAEGDHHWRTHVTTCADTADRRLRGVLRQLDAIRARIATGEIPTDDDLAFITQSSTITH